MDPSCPFCDYCDKTSRSIINIANHLLACHYGEEVRGIAFAMPQEEESFTLAVRGGHIHYPVPKGERYRYIRCFCGGIFHRTMQRLTEMNDHYTDFERHLLLEGGAMLHMLNLTLGSDADVRAEPGEL